MVYLIRSGVEVSEKCQRAAIFINSMQGSLSADRWAEHRLLVSYMESSDAGIFVAGAKLTRFWFSRVRSLMMSSALFLVLRFQTMPEDHRDQLTQQWGRFLAALAIWG